jgi:hypothetical protein
MDRKAAQNPFLSNDDAQVDGIKSPATEISLASNAAFSSGDLDLDAMRLPTDFTAIAGVQRVLTMVPIRKPSPQAYVRVHPDEAWTLMVAVVELKEDNDVYLVRPALYPALAEEAKAKQLYVGVTRDGNPFVWLVNMPLPDGRLDTWSQSAHAGANLAKTHWVRIKSNRDLGAYEVLQATNLKDEPSWPELSFKELVNLAFRGKVIDSLDHVVIRRLRGEI